VPTAGGRPQTGQLGHSPLEDPGPLYGTLNVKLKNGATTTDRSVHQMVHHLVEKLAHVCYY